MKTTIKHQKWTASHKIGWMIAITILDALINWEFLLTHCSLPQTMLRLLLFPFLKNNLHTQLPFVIL